MSRNRQQYQQMCKSKHILLNTLDYLALVVAIGVVSLPCGFAVARAGEATGDLLKGVAAMGDWTTDAPGVRRLITIGDLPQPYATSSSDNGPHLVSQPAGAWPKVPKGFTVDLLAEGLDNARKIITAPNGDLFLAESGPGRIKVFHQGKDGLGRLSLDTTPIEPLPGFDTVWVDKDRVRHSTATCPAITKPLTPSLRFVAEKKASPCPACCRS